MPHDLPSATQWPGPARADTPEGGEHRTPGAPEALAALAGLGTHEQRPTAGFAQERTCLRAQPKGRAGRNKAVQLGQPFGADGTSAPSKSASARQQGGGHPGSHRIMTGTIHARTPLLKRRDCCTAAASGSSTDSKVQRQLGTTKFLAAKPPCAPLVPAASSRLNDARNHASVPDAQPRRSPSKSRRDDYRTTDTGPCIARTASGCTCVSVAGLGCRSQRQDTAPRRRRLHR